MIPAAAVSQDDIWECGLNQWLCTETIFSCTLIWGVTAIKVLVLKMKHEYPFTWYL